MLLNWRRIISVVMVWSFILVSNVGTKKAKAETIPTGFVVIDQSNCGEFINVKINQLLNDGVKNIYIKNGIYNLNSMIKINKADIKLIGEDKNNTKLVQTQKNCDSIGVHNADNVMVSNLTIDNSASGFAGFSEGNSNNITLQDCIIYGDNSTFAVYFSGKNYPSDISINPVSGFEKSDMDYNNKMISNIVYSKYWGDGVSFSVQKNGLVENNIVNGTRIAFYICRDSQVKNNNIRNSASNGIHVSIPSENNIITGNVIENSKASAIKVSAEVEYPVETSYYGNKITISNNTISNPHYMGIEINQLANSFIENNNIDKPDNVGIYLLRANNVKVRNNILKNIGYSVIDGNLWYWREDWNTGIFADYKVTNSIIDSNTLNNQEFYCAYGIRELQGNYNEMNVFTNNNIEGKFIVPSAIIL
ncbi:right-handed parallel beta-helix repeat-containing protein [Clostridium sp. C2-6-12]|uniref:right-handed parallel beta-helix repeat-containing protein n=1 Tax=Clostridium sp. C2-6-12 TaxID=2698832 RepID=UPI001368666D|nr:right-handed parallel beta-helix repeat-containing protein [Clostridium sp. C2-6-12]